LKILILKPSSLGDVVQALPVARLLKAHEPRHEIYWWISAELVELLQPDPDLSGVFLFQRKRSAWPWFWGEVLGTVREMRAHQFDWVLDLQGLARSSLVAWLADGQLSVGVEDWREGAPALYDLVIPRPSPLTHAVDWYLEVVRALGVPVHRDFVWMPERPQAAEAVRRKWQIADGKWIVIIPGARWANKRWPVEYFAEVVRQLAARHRELHFAILGSQADAALGATIWQAARQHCLDLTGRTSLGEMLEWIRLSDAVISNDTGPMHIAAALAKPIVSIFGPTEPHRTGPYGQIERALRIDLPCAPCLKPRCHSDKPLECLRAITPIQVCVRAEAVLQLNNR
jgi:heptosyltransferase I